MYDLSSVQVLKGPQGTLFGRNTTGGALLLTPKRPGRTFGGDFMAGYGSYGRDETQFGIDLPLADNFTMRLRSEEHTSELQSLMRISYAVFCLKKKNEKQIIRI